MLSEANQYDKISISKIIIRELVTMVGEFYTQRRRWGPSTQANIIDLLVSGKQLIKINPNVSAPYIAYQGMLMIGNIIGKHKESSLALYFLCASPHS